MLLLSTVLPIVSLARRVAASPTDSFRESLTLHPLPDGKLSVLFEFTTDFTSVSHRSSTIHQSHHSLTPPSLLLPLEQNNVSELTISFVAGQWDQRRSGEAGPLHYESGGGGGEVRGWLRDGGDEKATSEAWTRVTHALGGLFCAGLGPNQPGESVNTFGGIYPPQRSGLDNLTHYLLPHPFLHLCTENLTPFLSLLPSKGLSGLSALLAQPGIIFSWGFNTEGIEVVMPSPGAPGHWRGWWEGVVDLVPLKGGRRDLSIESLFKRGIPPSFPEADESVLRLIMPEKEMQMDPPAVSTRKGWIDGKWREVKEWDLSNSQLDNVMFGWDGEGDFEYPRTFTPPSISICRTVTSRYASDGVFTIRIEHTGDETRSAIYSELWPWWVKGWLHEITMTQIGHGLRPDLVESMFYEPSTPPTTSATTLHLTLIIPPRSTLMLKIPFTKLTLKYTEHRPDAERGVEIPSGALALLDLEGESGDPPTDDGPRPRRSGRTRLYTTLLLLDVPTPDFSMPYNVIIMSSTVMAVFFGLMQGTLTRQWGWVELPKDDRDAGKGNDKMNDQAESAGGDTEMKGGENGMVER